MQETVDKRVEKYCRHSLVNSLAERETLPVFAEALRIKSVCLQLSFESKSKFRILSYTESIIIPYLDISTNI